MPSGASPASAACAAPPSASWRSDARLRPRPAGDASTLHAFLDLDDPARTDRVLAPAPRHLAIPRRLRRTSFAHGAARGLRLAVSRLSAAAHGRGHARTHGALLRPAPEPDESLRARAAARRVVRRAAARGGERNPARPRRRGGVSRTRARRKLRRDSRSRTSWTEPSAEYERRLIAAVKRAATPDAVVVLRSFREAPTATANQPRRRRSRDALGHRRRPSRGAMVSAR